MKYDLKINHKSNITLSIGNTIFDEIKKDAEFQGMSINSKVNQILAKHVLFYRLVEENESSIISSSIWDSIIELIDEEKIKKIMNEEGMSHIYSMFVNNNIPVSIDNFVKYSLSEIGIWSGMYSSFREFKEKNGNRVLIFDHRFGIKWSRVLEQIFSNTIRTMLNLPTETEILPTTVKIVIRDTQSDRN